MHIARLCRPTEHALQTHQAAALRKDFQREASLLKQMRHPHVVLYIGWFSSKTMGGGGGRRPSSSSSLPVTSLCFVTELCSTSLYTLLHDPQMARAAQPWAR